MRTDDVEAMTSFFREVIGLEAAGEGDEPVWAAEAFGDPTLGEFAWFFVRAPGGRVFAFEQVPD